MIHVVKDEEFCSNRKRSYLEEYQQFGFNTNYNIINGRFPVKYRLNAIMTNDCVTGEGGSGEARTDVSLSDSQFLAALDDTLTFAASTKQFVVNAVTVTVKMDNAEHEHLKKIISRPLEE